MLRDKLVSRHRVPQDQLLLLVDESRIRLEQGIPAFLEKVPADAQLTVYLVGRTLVGEDEVAYLATRDLSCSRVEVTGLPLRWFVGGGLAMLIIAPLAYMFGLHDYQRRRVMIFMDPESDPLGSGYHITQSKIAIGSGGIFGKGFGNGSQSHLEYLPESHTDFVFATMAEEWGLIGGLFVLLIFFLVLRWGIGVARRSPDRFSQLLAAGMVATIFFYMAINMSMVMGLAPVVGIPLPFMSHGGSSMMTNMICIGTLMAIDRWRIRPSGLS